MSIEEIIIYLRQQLLELRGENDQRAISELLSTLKMLTKISFDNGNKELTSVLVNLTDAARELYMGKPLNGKVPDEQTIRAALAAAPAAMTPAEKPAPPAKAPEEDRPISNISTEEIKELEVSFNHETAIQKRLRALGSRDWYDHTAIRDGSKRQMKAYSAVYDQLLLFRRLKAHDPVWIGHFPLNIDTETSSINIICNPDSLRPFLMQIKDLYSEQDDFRLTWKAVDRVPTVVVRFTVNGFNVEIFAQPKPTAAQTPFVQMLVAARMLAMGGEPAYEAIREALAAGNTLPQALVDYFDIQTDDPAQMLFEYARMDNEILRRELTLPEPEAVPA